MQMMKRKARPSTCRRTWLRNNYFQVTNTDGRIMCSFEIIAHCAVSEHSAMEVRRTVRELLSTGDECSARLDACDRRIQPLDVAQGYRTESRLERLRMDSVRWDSKRCRIVSTTVSAESARLNKIASDIQQQAHTVCQVALRLRIAQQCMY